MYRPSLVEAKELSEGYTVVPVSLEILSDIKTPIAGLPPVIEGARYHSLAMLRETLPDELLIIAEDNAGEVLGVKHRDAEVFGVQFHPESILTPRGKTILENFLTLGKSQDIIDRRAVK